VDAAPHLLAGEFTGCFISTWSKVSGQDARGETGGDGL
jgi:hypothetical protein